MSSRAVNLALRKHGLMLESDALRRRLALQGAALRPAFGVADGVRAGWRWLQANPAAVAGVVVAAFVLRPPFVLRWLRRGWVAWRFWHGVRNFQSRPVPADR